jgi:hypothetical protein
MVHCKGCKYYKIYSVNGAKGAKCVHKSNLVTDIDYNKYKCIRLLSPSEKNPNGYCSHFKGTLFYILKRFIFKTN